MVRSFWDYFLISIGILFFFYLSLGDRLFDLNNVQLDQSGDGLKNYYTLAYHYKYLEGFHFSGFLYPYGDLTLYADSQIGLIWILRGLSFVGLDVSPYLLGILNILPILSFLIGGFLISHILRHYKTNQKYIAFTAIFCMAMSPQIWRTQSHYALSYAFIFPLIWILVLRFQKVLHNSSRLVYSCILIFLLTFFAFIHAYHLVVNALFILAFGFVYFQSNRRISTCLITVATIAPILFLTIASILDAATDRPKNPYGMSAYRTEVSDLFPFYGKINEVLSHWFPLRDSYTEGYCYVSFLPFILLVIFIITKIFLSKKQNIFTLIDLPKSLRFSFYASLICLSFAMGLHLLISNNLILDILPQLKQFRGLGRFSWPFYYVAFIYASIILWKMVDKLHKPLIKYLIPIVVFAIWMAEATAYHNSFRKNVDTYSSGDLLSTQHTISDILDSSKYDISNFQAILTLPPSTEGGEKINLENNYHIKTRVLPFSYQTGIPLTTSIMSRVPISTTLNILKLSSSSYGEKNLKSPSLLDNRPFLIIIHRDYIEHFQNLLDRSNIIGKSKFLELYSIEANRLMKRECYDVSLSSLDLATTKHFESQDTLVHFEDFSDQDNMGMGNLRGSFFCVSGECEIVNFDISEQTEKDIKLSFWYKVIDDKSSVPSFIFKVYDSNGKVSISDDFRDWHMPRMEVYGNWVRFVRSYKIGSSAHKVNLVVHGKYAYIDNLLLKSENIAVHLNLNGNEAYANHLMIVKCE